MRILHTSDWHLGKKLYKKERVEEHTLFLQWLLEEIPKQAIQVLVIAGDIFDTPIPTTGSLTIFFKFLKDLEAHSTQSGGTLKKVLILAGNHDSARLLESPRPFLNTDFIKVVGSLRPPTSLTKEDIQKWQDNYVISIAEKGNEFKFCLLPFFRTREIIDNPWLKIYLENSEKELSVDETLISSLRTFLNHLFELPKESCTSDITSPPWIEVRENNNAKRILVSHHLFGSFMSAGSEQSVALSGLDSIPLSLFEDWDLLLLGHIHKPQIIRKKPLAIYCGSPIPLRFSESNNKQVVILDWNEEENCFQNKSLAIPAFRTLLRIKTDRENFKEDILREIKSSTEDQTSLESPLNTFLEISIKNYSSVVLEEIRDFISELPVELLNYYADINLDEKVEKESVNMDAITDKSTSELFTLFLENSKLSEGDIKGLGKDFAQLLDEQFKEKVGDLENPENGNLDSNQGHQ